MTPNCQSRHVLILIVLSRWTQVKGKMFRKKTYPEKLLSKLIKKIPANEKGKLFAFREISSRYLWEGIYFLLKMTVSKRFYFYGNPLLTLF